MVVEPVGARHVLFDYAPRRSIGVAGAEQRGRPRPDLRPPHVAVGISADLKFRVAVRIDDAAEDAHAFATQLHLGVEQELIRESAIVRRMRRKKFVDPDRVFEHQRAQTRDFEVRHAFGLERSFEFAVEHRVLPLVPRAIVVVAQISGAAVEHAPMPQLVQQVERVQVRVFVATFARLDHAEVGREVATRNPVIRCPHLADGLAQGAEHRIVEEDLGFGADESDGLSPVNFHGSLLETER